MADRRKPKSSHRRSDPLAMKIYSAFLGGLPRIVRAATSQQLNDEDSPFHAPSLRRKIRRATGSVGRALDEARDRLHRSTPIATAVKKPDATVAQPLVLIGGAAVRRRVAAEAERVARPAA